MKLVSPAEEGIPSTGNERFGDMTGRAPVMQAVFARVARAAMTDLAVLLIGETGTGKEVTAQAIHRASRRATRPFVVVDCAGVPPALLESELFGHERGAFTGAVAARAGAFELAAGGTIFLDELGELGGDLQPKLLRALDTRMVKRVGGDEWRSADVRVIVATNRDLPAEVEAGRFRSDLYYRIAVLEIRLPPLRERLEDLPILVDDILTRLGVTDREEAALLRTPQARVDMACHAWPGNVRELRNYVERCVALGELTPLGIAGDTAEVGMELRAARRYWARFGARLERQYLEDLLADHDGNISAAARSAGVDRKHMYRLLWRHGLR